MKERRATGNSYLYRGAAYSNELTQGNPISGSAQCLPGLSEVVGNRAVLWLGPKKMALEYCGSEGVLGKFGIKALLHAAQSQGCDILLIDKGDLPKHQLHVQGKTNNPQNYYRHHIVSAESIKNVGRLVSAHEVAIILPEGETVLRLPKGALQWSHDSLPNQIGHGGQPNKQRKLHERAPGDYHRSALLFSGKLDDAFQKHFFAVLGNLREKLQKIHDEHITPTERVHTLPSRVIIRDRFIIMLTNKFILELKELTTSLDGERKLGNAANGKNLEERYLKVDREILEKLNPLLKEEEKIHPRRISKEPSYHQEPPLLDDNIKGPEQEFPLSM